MKDMNEFPSTKSTAAIATIAMVINFIRKGQATFQSKKGDQLMLKPKAVE